MKFRKTAAGMVWVLIAFLFILQPIFGSEIDALIDQAIMYEREGRLEQAIEVYRQILHKDPSNVMVQVRLAKILGWENRFEEALQILNQVLDKHPNHSEALFRKAQILSWQKEYSQSIQAYRKYLSLEKDDADALLGIARVCFWSGENQKAVSYFKQAIQAGAGEAEARLEMGKVYLAMDQKQKAAQEFKQVLKLSPDNQEAKRFLRGIHTLKTVEIYPSNMKWTIYPDNSMGITVTAGMTYHIKQLWDITFLYQNKVINAAHDHIFGLSVLYRGVKNLYLSGELSGTRDADFSPLAATQLGIGYDFGTLGANVNWKADMYSNEALFCISPGLLRYFSDVSYIHLIFNYFWYTTGYSTSKMEFRAKLEYSNTNTININLVYGGDVEIKDPQRRIFDITAGTTFNITDNLETTLSYGWIETEYGRTHQLTYESAVKW